MATNNPFLQKMIDVRSEAIGLLGEHGLWQEGWRFVFTNGKTQVGICKHREKQIGFSQHFLLKTEREDITDTLLHEIAHALVGSGHGHDHVWRRKAIEIGCNGERTCGDEAVTTAKFNYVIECDDCGNKYYRYRLKRTMHTAKCGRCHGNLTVYKYVRG